ncbi:uncharacterized protein K02A2.6-like [Ornithodoros turicata]|uniref:uncharacterized protein K02A2.6-like n=1 Tax=Ornithodoros turicata TaxID=34597 RepID=UPI0031391929
MQVIHLAHQGLVKTKQLIREKVWFPGIDQKTEAVIKSCAACQTTVEEKRVSPLMMTPLPDGPWQSLAADFAGPLPGNSYLLVVVDEYSRFPIVATLSSLTTTSVTAKLNDIFAVHGLPHVLKTDNGPPFFSKEFASYLRQNGIRHHRTTPLWPQANGEAERFIRSIKKTVKAAGASGSNWKEEISNYLLNYRATPHSTTGITPAELLFGRKIRTRIPEIPEKKPHENLEKRDREKKEQMKAYADKQRHAAHHELRQGDTVLLKRQSPLSCESAYDPRPYRVIRVQGTAITAERDNKKIVRNASFFKRVPEIPSQDSDEWQTAEHPAHTAVPPANAEDSTSPFDASPDQRTTGSHTTASVTNCRSSERANRGKPPTRFADYFFM